LAKVSFLPVWLGPFGYPESCPDIAVGSRVDRRIGNIQLCVHLNSALPICQLFISICHLLAFTLCLDKGYIAACFLKNHRRRVIAAQKHGAQNQPPHAAVAIGKRMDFFKFGMNSRCPRNNIFFLRDC